MSNRTKEIAKFLSGVETFHAVTHAYLFQSGTQLTILGMTTTPTLNAVSVVVTSAVALALGIYAWRR